MRKTINEFLEKIVKIPMMLAADYLYKVRDQGEAKVLSVKQATVLHHSVAQLLFVSSQVRRDICMAEAFLIMKVKNLNEND